MGLKLGMPGNILHPLIAIQRVVGFIIDPDQLGT